MFEESLKTKLWENYLIYPPEISDFNDNNNSFLESLNKLNPSNLYFLDENGNSIDSNNPYLKSTLLCVVCKNPNVYSEKDLKGINGKLVTKSSFNSLAASIRQSRESFCSGQISRSYFLDSQKNCDIFFLLYILLIPKRKSLNDHRSILFLGFASCNDLSINNIFDNLNSKSIYIDLLCCKLQLRENEKFITINKSKKIKIKPGQILINCIEKFALQNQFKQIKLSSLGYVINYYRKCGFIHSKDLTKNEPSDIKAVSKKTINIRFQSESQANLTYLVEKVIHFLDRSRSIDDQENDFIVNLKNILKTTDTPFESFGEKHEDPISIVNKILNLLPKPKYKKKLTLEMISNSKYKDYFGYYKLLSLLIKNKFAVSYENGKYSQRTKIKNEEDEEIDFTEDGFSMSKNLD